jgi:hypothetical protein
MGFPLIECLRTVDSDDLLIHDMRIERMKVG